MQATDTMTPETPRWGFTLGCAVVSLGLLGLGFFARRAAPPRVGSPPSHGVDIFADPEADLLALAAQPAVTTPAPGARAVTPRPSIKVGAMAVSGRLPPEVIGRILRQQHGRVRLCYENGLHTNPALQGRVAVRFVIGRDGAVSSVANGGSDLPDGGVVSCVIRTFYGTSFPQPERGIVTVTYPISFAPR